MFLGGLANVDRCGSISTGVHLVVKGEALVMLVTFGV